MGSCTSKQLDSSKPSEAPNTSNKRNEQKQPLANNKNNTNGSKDHNASTDSSNEMHSTYPEKSAIENSNATSSSAGSEKEVKVLLLGSGESGKSTIVKQMKILHQNGYTTEELYEYKPFVYKNVLECIKSVINAIIDLEPDLIHKENEAGEIEMIGNNTVGSDNQEDRVQQYNGASKEGNRKHVLDYDMLNEVLDYEININVDENFNPDIADKIIRIYKTPEVQKFIKYQQGKFYLIDSTNYFLNDLERIAKVGYCPSVDDILRTRKKTSGIFDFKFQMSGGLNIHMFDVGGQRSERKKWIHCFDNVTSIIFCVALSEYDQVLLEENSQNRLEESLILFDSVVNSRWFARTSIVLFLNKIDVFAEKLPYSPLENHFPDYTGGNNINKAAKYILWRFNQVNRSGLSIYPHVTQATDTSNIQLVFAAIKETILENSLKDSGLL
mmetsp:Transcript_767/g.748  ORF Transcript_767/g.748 Transcript_767/m.748 type:complete len:441 (+) Transcript_767:264-1586(+)